MANKHDQSRRHVRILATAVSWARIFLGCGFAFGWLPLLNIFLREGVFASTCGHADTPHNTFECPNQQHLLNFQYTLGACVIDLGGIFAGAVFQWLGNSRRAGAWAGEAVHLFGAAFLVAGALLPAALGRDVMWFVGYLILGASSMFIFIPISAGDDAPASTSPGMWPALATSIALACFNAGIVVPAIMQVCYDHGYPLSAIFSVYAALDVVFVGLAWVYTQPASPNPRSAETDDSGNAPLLLPDTVTSESPALSTDATVEPDGGAALSATLTPPPVDCDEERGVDASLVCNYLRLSAKAYQGLVWYALLMAIPIKYVLGVATTEITLLAPGPGPAQLATILSSYLWLAVIISALIVGPILHLFGLQSSLRPSDRRAGLVKALVVAPVLIIILAAARLSENYIAFFVATMTVLPAAWGALYTVVICFISHVLPSRRNSFGLLISLQAGVVLLVWPLTLWGTPEPSVTRSGPYILFIALSLAALCFPIWYRSRGTVKCQCGAHTGSPNPHDRNDLHEFTWGLWCCHRQRDSDL
jgi:MFS family permease